MAKRKEVRLAQNIVFMWALSILIALFLGYISFPILYPLIGWP